MNNNNNKPGGLGNSSNPRPGQSPFPQSGPLVRQTPINSQSSQPYTSSYNNNFDRTNARFSTGRTDESRYSQDANDYTIPPRSPPRPAPRREQAGRAWEESIYGMYGDLKTPKEPPPKQNPKFRRPYQQEQQDDDGEDSYDEEVPRRPSPDAQRPRFNRARTSPGPGPGPGPRRANTTRQQNQRSERSGRQDRRDRRDPQDRQEQRDADGNYHRVHINIDTGGDGGRSWSWSTDDRDRTNVNVGTPFGGSSGPSLVNFGDSAFPFGGRNHNGGRLPVNVPFVNGLPINLPFGL